MTTHRKFKFASQGSWLVVEGLPGLTIASSTPLTRLNYFDGKRLDAADLKLEQDAQRRLVQLSNLGGGFGIVHGFDTALVRGDQLAVGPGQAIDADGRVLLLPLSVDVAITELIARSLAQPAAKPAGAATAELFGDCELVAADPPGQVGTETGLWLITIAHAEFLCGEQEVFGKLCEQACVSSIERAFRVEGVVLRARKLELGTPLVNSDAVSLTAKHQRSRVASAYFADERKQPASLISGAGLRSEAWCRGAELAAGEIALGVLSRKGTSNLWFDAWTARRERMQSPAQTYWAGRMAMRPWPRFLAQVLQFQCQLSRLLRELGDGEPGHELIDPCADPKHTIAGARDAVDALLAHWSEAGVDLGGELRMFTVGSLEQLRNQLTSDASSDTATSGKRILIDGGFVELPPAGYLPVDPRSSMTVNEQVRRLLGEGVDLRFCVVRPDDVARELEGAQHMDRISLLRGLDDPSAKPPVDILVPDGTLIERAHAADGLSFRAKLALGRLPPGAAPGWKPLVSELDERLAGISRYRGAARATSYRAGGGEAQLAALVQLGAAIHVDVQRLAPLDDFPRADGMIKELLARAAAPAGAGLGVAPGAAFNVAAVAPDAAAAPFQALWLDMSSSGDPFATRIGSALNVSFVLRVAVANSFVEYRLSGSARIIHRQELRTDQAVYGQLAAARLTAVETHRGFGPESSATVEFNVTLIDLAASGKPGVLVSLRPASGNPLLDHDLVLAWDGESLDVSGLWALRPLNQQLSQSELLFSDLDHDPGVLAESDADHGAALEALSVIASAMDDPDFVREAAAKLFPPSLTTSTLEVQAVHDWVMFHARHRKQCDLEPAERPVPGRPRYRLYAYDLGDLDLDDPVGTVAEYLRTNAPELGQFNFTDVGVIEYEVGSATLASSAAAIEALWKPHASDRLLAWAGIASVATRRDELARTRLLALEQVVETLTPPDPEQPSRVLAQVPHVLDPRGADGVIVLLTIPTVFRISLYVADNWASEQLLALAIPADAPAGEELDTLLHVTESTHVGEFEFAGGRVTQRSPGESMTVHQPTRVIVYTRRQRGELEAAITEAYALLDIDIAQVPFAHLRFPFDWSDERGDVVVIATGEMGEVM